MTFEQLSKPGLDYLSCRYDGSKLTFRGPRRRLDKPYVAMIGGSEIFGRFSETTVPEMLEALTGFPVVNFGHLNAGIDAYLQDPAVLEICRRAEVTVIQVIGAHNMSNRLYSVHPRRNDRLVQPSNFLKTLYREPDYTQFHYTRHLLTTLHQLSPDRFDLVADELGTAWSARMGTLINIIGGEVCVLWMSDRKPDDAGMRDPLGRDPLFVTASHLATLKSRVSDYVEVIASQEEISAGQERLVFSAFEEPVAREMLGPVAYEATARALQKVVLGLA